MVGEMVTKISVVEIEQDGADRRWLIRSGTGDMPSAKEIFTLSQIPRVGAWHPSHPSLCVVSVTIESVTAHEYGVDVVYGDANRLFERSGGSGTAWLEM